MHSILSDHIDNFSLSYDERYAADHGKSSLTRIVDCVDKFLECGDYSLGVARIKCANQKCDYEYFRPFLVRLAHHRPASSGVFTRPVITSASLGTGANEYSSFPRG